MQSRLSQRDSQHAVLPVSDDAPVPQSSAQIPSADEGGSSMASEMGDVLSTPSLPLAVSTPAKETLPGECGKDGAESSGTPCNDSIVDTPIGKGRDTVYVPDTPEMRNIGETRGGNTPFLTSAKQLDSLIRDINRTSHCKAPNCNGELRLKDVELVGMGGDGKANFVCSGGCETRNICLPFSDIHEESQQNVVPFALQVAFICSGANYAQYETVLGSMGMHHVNDYTFYETIVLLDGHTTELLVTEADGVWMTRGHHSQNFTFHVRDYMTNSVLYYKHLCQRGKGGPLYEGTSASMEGAAAKEIFAKMKEDGMNIAVHWQDADSTAEKEVRKHFGDVTKLCGGHYNRAHYNLLKKMKGNKSFSTFDQSKYKDGFPEVLTAKCCCTTRHKPGCGCVTDPFIAGARKKLTT